MKVTQCKTNHLESPLGYLMDRPVFSYAVEDAQSKRQTKARVRVSLDADMGSLLYDSGFRADIDSLAFEALVALKPRTRYYWDAAVISDAGEEAASPVNWFETGKRDEPWAGQWITCDSSNPRHPVFFKDLSLARPVKSARLYICGLGLYEAYLNGEKISGEMLTPYCNNYHQWLQYQTYDVTAQLQKSGKLEVLLGNGWYKGRFGFVSKSDSEPFYGKNWKLIAEVHVAYTDGSEAVLGTDENWQVSRSSILASNIYDGETVDETLPEVSAVPAGLCLEPAMPLTDRLSTPVTVHEELVPVELIHTPAGETVLDLGQNIAGSFRLKVREPRGARIHLLFGEILQNGNFYRDNLRSAKAEYFFTCGGSPAVIQPHFTFYGYRYVKIEGVKDLKKEDFTGLALYSQIPLAGTLSTGNPQVNRLIQNARWGQKGNFLDVPTDCPQRDERMGWTGDAQVFSATACFQRDCAAFFRKFLHDMRTEQAEHGGMVPSVIPAFGHDGTSSAWGDAACIIPWNLYLFYGDKGLLAEAYPGMKAWVDYVAQVEGNNHGWREVFHYGDWLALDNPAGGVDQCFGGTDVGFIASVYYLYSTRLLVKAAKVLGKTEDAAAYEALAGQILKDIREEYFSKTGRCCAGTQTGLVLTLLHGLTDALDKTRAALKKKFQDSKGKLQTGFVGTPLLCGVLCDNGMGELAYNLLLNEEYPGWLYEVNLGATTIWERWNSVLPDGSISSTGMNSLNHYAYGSIVEWIYRYAAGINPVEDFPGFRKILLKPLPDLRLKHLEVECRTAAGTYRSAWRFLDDSRIEFRFIVPFGCEADLVLPHTPDSVYADASNPIFADVREEICHLAAGTYTVAYQALKG